MIRFLADYLLIILLASGSAVLLYDCIKRSLWRRVPYVVMAGLTSLLFAKLISLVYQPELVRPFVEKGVDPGAAFIDNPGFPSDHALLGGVVVLAVYAFTGRRWVSLILLVMALVMMVARVLALVHTPFDVVGGAAIAAVGGLWYIMMRRNEK